MADSLLEVYPETDDVLNNISWPPEKYTSRVEFKTKERFYTELNSHRYTLQDKKTTMKQEISYYTDMMNVFILWIFGSITEVGSVGVWKELVAYQVCIFEFLFPAYIGENYVWSLYDW